MSISWVQTLWFAKLADQAYENILPPELTVGYQAELKTSKGTELWILTNAESVVLIYRGTEMSAQDIIDDLDTTLVDFKDYGKVHQGFLTAVGRISFLALMKERNPNKEKTIYCVGHSLGGALATLAGIRLLDTGYKVGGIYTFGCPAIGDPKFCATWTAKGIENYNCRFRVNNDVISLLPSIGYSQLGKQIFINRRGKAEIKSANWMRVIDRLPFWILLPFSSHRMAHYISAIQALSDSNQTL
jgi:hypothetical protein